MPIAITCKECGASMKVKDELAGKRIRCRHCSEVIAVPRPAEDDDALLDQLVQEERSSAAFDEPPGAPPRARRKTQAKPERPARPRSGGGGAALKSILVIGALVALSLVVLCGGGAGFVWYQARSVARGEVQSVDTLVKGAQAHVAIKYDDFCKELLTCLRDDCSDYAPIHAKLKLAVDTGKLTIGEVDGLPIRSDLGRTVVASTREWIVAQENLANGPLAEMLRILDDRSRSLDDRYQDLLKVVANSKTTIEAVAVKQATAHRSYLEQNDITISPDYNQELISYSSPLALLLFMPPTRQAIGALHSEVQGTPDPTRGRRSN
jgi:predicted Zn finger-like uncharacterized protein